MVLARSLLRNMGLSLMLVFWCLSINCIPTLASGVGGSSGRTATAGVATGPGSTPEGGKFPKGSSSSSSSTATTAPAGAGRAASPRAAGSAPQPRSFYGGGGFGGGGYGGGVGYGGGHDLLDRGFGGEFLPIFALIGFAVIFLPFLGALMASMTQFAAPIGFPLNQAVTTATVAGRRRRRDVEDESVMKLIKGFEKFYQGFQATRS